MDDEEGDQNTVSQRPSCVGGTHLKDAAGHLHLGVSWQAMIKDPAADGRRLGSRAIQSTGYIDERVVGCHANNRQRP